MASFRRLDREGFEVNCVVELSPDIDTAVEMDPSTELAYVLFLLCQTHLGLLVRGCAS